MNNNEENKAKESVENLSELYSQINSLINKYNEEANKQVDGSRLALAVKQIYIEDIIEDKFYEEYNRSPNKEEIEEFKKTIDVETLIENYLEDDYGCVIRSNSGWFPSMVCW